MKGDCAEVVAKKPSNYVQIKSLCDLVHASEVEEENSHKLKVFFFKKKRGILILESCALMIYKLDRVGTFILYRGKV